MTSPVQLWTTGEIAKELGVSSRLVYNWAYYGLSFLPEAFAVTQSGMRFWTADQAKQIIAGYYERKTARDQRKASSEREQRMLERLTS